MSKNNDRYKVNFQSERVRSVINYLQLAENRLSREELLSIGTKDILYQLKHNGYIKESSRGTFQATKKLRDKVTKETGKQFGKGSSSPHSQKLLDVAKCIPQEIIIYRSFQTGTELENSFNRFKQCDEYKGSTEKARQEYMSKIANLNRQHNTIQSSQTVSQREKLQENVQYLQSVSALERNLSVVEKERYSVPDFAFTCSREQGQAFITELQETKNSFYRLDTAIHQMKQIIGETSTDTITFSIEIVTTNYGTEDLLRHFEYDKITDTKTIYL